MLRVKEKTLCVIQFATASDLMYDSGLKLQLHSLIVQRSSDVTLAASAAVQVVAQCPVLRLQTHKDGQRAR